MSFITLIHFVLCSNFNSCENFPRLLRAYSGYIRVKFIYLSFYIAFVLFPWSIQAKFSFTFPTLVIKVGFRMRTVLSFFPFFVGRSFAVLPRLPTISAWVLSGIRVNLASEPICP